MLLLPCPCQEIASVLQREDGSRVGPGRVVHTDAARAYKQLEVEEGPLFDGSFCDADQLRSLKLAHTHVRHKPPKPEFAKTCQVSVWQGLGDSFEVETRVAETQKFNGFSAASDKRSEGNLSTRQVLLYRPLRPWRPLSTNVCVLSSWRTGFQGRTCFRLWASFGRTSAKNLVLLAGPCSPILRQAQSRSNLCLFNAWVSRRKKRLKGR